MLPSSAASDQQPPLPALLRRVPCRLACYRWHLAHRHHRCCCCCWQHAEPGAAPRCVRPRLPGCRPARGLLVRWQQEHAPAGHQSQGRKDRPGAREPRPGRRRVDGKRRQQAAYPAEGVVHSCGATIRQPSTQCEYLVQGKQAVIHKPDKVRRWPWLHRACEQGSRHANMACKHGMQSWHANKHPGASTRAPHHLHGTATNLNKECGM